MANKRHGSVPIYPGGGGNTGSGTGPKHTDAPPPKTTSTPDPYAAAQAKADAKEKKYQRKASDRYKAQAETMRQQAQALRVALGKHGFRAALEQKLANVTLTTRQQDAELRRGYRERVGSLENIASDNEKASAGQSYANLSNAGRERANALSEAMLQGAGESDVLRAQGAALRNWNANQSDVARNFFDTQTSINSSLTDLTTDTRTARVNNRLAANSDREQLWTNYYDRRSETLTQLGNTLGEMANAYGAANEQVTSKKVQKQQKALDKKSGDAFERAALTSGKAWENPGVPKSIRKWDGHDAFSSPFGQGPSLKPDVDLGRPEGATLRSW